MAKTYTKKNLIDLVVKAAAEAALTNSVETAHLAADPERMDVEVRLKAGEARGVIRFKEHFLEVLNREDLDG